MDKSEWECGQAILGEYAIEKELDRSGMGRSAKRQGAHYGKR